jgi:hypothetical protein
LELQAGFCTLRTLPVLRTPQRGGAGRDYRKNGVKDKDRKIKDRKIASPVIFLSLCLPAFGLFGDLASPCEQLFVLATKTNSGC